MEKFRITLNGVVHEVEVERISGGTPSHTAAPVKAAPVAPAAPAAPAPKAAVAVPAGAKTVQAPMPGKILSVNVNPGQAVKRGEILAVLEAMKMANEIMAPADGTVSDVNISVGQAVSTGEVLIVLS